MSTKPFKIPLDTLGHPLPPPVPSNTVCKIPRRDWGKWWLKYFNNTLPEEQGCCVCGYSFESWQLTTLDTELVDLKVQRQYLNGMMSKNLFLCPSCRRKCSRCERPVPEAQKKLFRDLCQKCHGGEAAAKKHKPAKPKGSLN
jgi:hypothetical protein